MTPEARPAAVPFDPGSGEIPPTLGPVITDPEQPILLLVAPDSGDSAARTAIGIADARARRGLATILADGALEDPRLHELLDVPNLEGLADVFLFGASLARVATRPETRAFDFIPAGAYVPDADAVWSSARWERIGAELRASETLMLLFAAAGTPAATSLSRQVGRAVLIGDERNLERIAARLDPACDIVGAVEPVPALAPERLAEEAGPAPAPGSATIFDEPDLTEPLVFRSQRRRRRSAAPLILIMLVLALGTAGWFAYRTFMGGRNAAAAAAEPAAAQAPERGRPVETPLPVSVAVEAHQDYAAALERIVGLQRAEPAIRFYLAPVSVNGVLYYRLLAGPLSDRDAGMTLMQRLVDRGHKTAFDEWAVRPTEFAFHLGDFTTREETADRLAELAGLDIPAYAVEIRYDSGPSAFRVYGGAYESQAEAQVMKEMLENAGLEARLVSRTGVPAS